MPWAGGPASFSSAAAPGAGGRQVHKISFPTGLTVTVETTVWAGAVTVTILPAAPEAVTVTTLPAPAEPPGAVTVTVAPGPAGAVTVTAGTGAPPGAVM